MSRKIITRSNSINKNTPESTARPESQTRKFSELSPEFLNEESKKPKEDNMSDQRIDNLNNFMGNIMQKIDMIIENMNGMNIKIDALRNDFHDLSTNMRNMGENIKEIEEEQAQQRNTLCDHEARLNMIEQLNLENQIMITNLPLAINRESFINDFNKWSNNRLDPSKINKVIINTYKNSSKTAFVHFRNSNDKLELMDFIKGKQIDKNRKFSPITNAHIFNLKSTDLSLPNIISFRTPMTDINKKIFNLAMKTKREKKTIDAISLRNGSINIKWRGQLKFTSIHSIEQLESTTPSLLTEMTS